MSQFTKSAALGIFLTILMLFPMKMKSQGFAVYGQVTNSQGRPAAYATIQVCPYTGSGIPCSPLSNIYSNLALTTGIPNPYTTDGNGNYSFFVSSNTTYILQVNVSGSVYSYFASAGNGGGGTSGCTSTSLTSGYIPVVSGTPCVFANSPLDYGVSNAGILTATAPLYMPTGSKVNGSAICTTATGCGGTALVPYGTLINQSTWSSLTGYTVNGTTPSVSAGALVFTGGAGTFTQTFDYNYQTQLPQWKVTCTYTVGTPGSTSYGLGCGMRSNNADGNFQSVMAYMDSSTSGSEGLLNIFSGPTPTLVATSATAVTFAAGDTIRLVISRNYDTITATVQDVTNGGLPVSASYQYLFGYSQSNIALNGGKFAVFNLGGTQTLTSMNISSATPVGADIACVGDSKTVGYYAGAYSDTWCIQLQNYYQTYPIAGGNDETVDIVMNLPEIVALHPKKVVLDIGGNDVRYSVPIGTIETNYANIVTTLTAAGIQVYPLLYSLENSGVNFGPLNSWIVATYPTTYINANNNFVSGSVPTTWIAGDNVHPTGLWHEYIANTVYQFFQGNGSSQVFNSYSEGALSVASFFNSAYSPNCTATGMWVGANGGEPEIQWCNASAGTDLKMSVIAIDSAGLMHFSRVNDAASSTHDFMTVHSTGLTPDKLNIPEAVTVGAGSDITYKGDNPLTVFGNLEAVAGGFNSGIFYASSTFKYSGNTSGFSFYDDQVGVSHLIVFPLNAGGYGATATAAPAFTVNDATGATSFQAQISAPSVKTSVYTVATLPTGLAAGSQVVVSDATSLTAGACVGGGSNYTIALYTGAAWNCM